MKGIKSYIPVMISLLISIVVILFIGIKSSNNYPNEIYKVYVDGNFIGAIRSKASLEKYINNEQKDLKEEYNVKKVYIPNGIDIEKTISYKGKLTSEEEIYKKIKQEKSFTIKGYVVTISKEDEEDKKIYLLKKDLFDKAVKQVLASFVSETELENYIKDRQPEIKTTGSIIENIYLGQDVSIQEAFISTDELIFTNQIALTKYLLFGSLDQGEEYTVKLGDTIETVAFNNKLSTQEFLIVNPEFTSANNLLSVGQKVNISLINPMLKMVVEKEIVEDVEKPYETIEKEDSTLYVGQTKVETEGVSGIQRVTEKIQYINGEPQEAFILPGAEVIKEPINKVVLKGTKKDYYYSGTAPVTSGNYAWPTVYPYVLTSNFEWRWGKLHAGLDISGCGMGSPIFAINEGTVLSTVSSCADVGYYGNSCGSGYGNSVWIAHPEGVYAVYGHLTSKVMVSPGEYVSKGQLIGFMGDSGSSTGTHLHFGTYYGGTQSGGGTPFNPFSLY